ncbi:MAG: outer membrane protein assembly factor BamA [Candidatus Marinarcus sp.]|uniref:outer membrane protein assembly factor BamA n=1 Tax=Candidatus Marinarcus sp. TaxID=3100987 RepID=UPI003AFFB194
MKKNATLLCLALASTLSAQTIQKIEFNNLSKVSAKIASETINIREGDELDIDKVNSAIKEFYQFGYFDDITVINNNGILEFNFVEKPSIANVEMTGYKSRQEDIDEVLKRIGLSKGTMYTKARIQKAKESLLQELQKEGYVNSVVEVEIETLSENSVSVSLAVNKGDEIIIKKVNYYGSENLDESDFEQVTANKEEDFITWWFGQNDGEAKIDQLPYENLRINELYFEHGYLDSKVKPPFLKVDFASNQAKLDFYIQEGPQYITDNITIYLDASILDPKTLYEGLKLKKDKVFNLKKLREDAEYIKTAVADLGYAFTEVKYDIQKDTKTNKASVVYSVIPGKKVYINDVFISGNSRTLDRVIRRDVYLAHGDLFSLTDYNDSVSKLKRNGFFEDVTIDQKRISEDKMDLVVKVKETSTGSLILGGGYGSYDGFIINASIQDRNIFGSGLNLGFSIDTSSKRNNNSISLSNPAIRDSAYNGSVEAHGNDLEIDYDNYTLNKDTVGFSVGAGKEIFRNFYGGLKYAFDSVDESYTGTTARKNQSYLVSSITPYINYNSTDDYYFPRSGFKAGTSLEIAGIGGDAEYFETSTYFKYYYSLENLLDWDAVFRYRGQVKMLIDNGMIPQGSTFYLGGPKSLRGYESYAFGPEDSAVDNPYKNYFSNGFELNFPLVPSAKMRWGVFYDYGMIGEDNFSQIKRSGTGALIEWISPVGPLQFIFSQPLDDEPGDKTSTFEFSLGTSF